MEARQDPDELKRALEEILELCLRTARRLRSVLEESDRRGLAVGGAGLNGSSPDEGVVRKSGPAPVEDGNR